MENQKANTFEGLSIEDRARGYSRQSGGWRCNYCGLVFEEGLVYQIAVGPALAERALREHVDSAHGGAFAALIGLGSAASGLPEVQEKVLRLLHEGKGDREIALALGGKSESTIRNHRFNLRKRAEEARTFLALMRLVEEGAPRDEAERFVKYPASVRADDERFIVTESEARAIEKHCLGSGPGGGLTISRWPKKQKDKLVLLRRVAELFEAGRHYTEGEVNVLLMPVYDDYVTLRRYLIEYRFLDRKPDGSDYWKIA
jgi:DNA-binding CsgD family transcriptional regulator